MDGYLIGGYIEYFNEYERTSNYGCIASIRDNGRCNVIRQDGGQIWIGVKPQNQIDEEIFLSDFYISDKNRNYLLEIKDTLPDRTREIIEQTSEKETMYVAKKVSTYVSANDLNNKNEKIRISPESWAIEWYVYRVLREYEPIEIRDTLTYCHGATDELKRFMKENVNFMIEMQFLPHEYENIMIYLIEEKILEFNYKLGSINLEDYVKRMFPVRKIKLENYLMFKNYVPNVNVKLQFTVNRKEHKFLMPINELLDTAIIIPSKHGISNINSKCLRIKRIKHFNEYIDENIKFETNRKNIENNIQINHIETHASRTISPSANLIIYSSCRSGGLMSKKTITLYGSKTGKLIGKFEIINNDYDCLTGIKVDIDECLL